MDKEAWIELASGIIISVAVPISVQFLNHKINEHFANKKSSSFKEGWLLCKRLYWEGDQTVNQAGGVQTITQKLLFLFCIPAIIGIVLSLFGNLLFFDEALLSQITYMVGGYLIRIIALLFVFIDLLGTLTTPKKWYLRIAKWGMAIIHIFCNIAVVYLVDSIGNGNTLQATNYAIIYFFSVYICLSGFLAFYLVNPFDIETSAKVYFNEDYLKYISGIKKCFYTSVDQKINFYEAIPYDKEKVILKLQTKCDYSKAGKYPVTFTVISKNNPERKTEFTSLIDVKELRESKSISELSKYLSRWLFAVTILLPFAVLGIFYLAG